MISTSENNTVPSKNTMEGNNSIEFNTATMKAAVQYYLDNCVLREGVGAVVTDIKLHQNNHTFLVSISTATKDK